MKHSRKGRKPRHPTPQRGDWYEVTPKSEDEERQEESATKARSAEPTRAPPPASSLPETASASGGASGAEDSTRAAGYVVDLAASRATPPGPPVALNPGLLTPPDEPPRAGARRARAAPGAASGSPRGSQAESREKRPSFDEIALARLEGESPATGASPSDGGSPPAP